MCFTNVNEAGKRYRYFMYSTNKCTDFNKNITLKKKKKKKKKKKIYIYTFRTVYHSFTSALLRYACFFMHKFIG